MQDSTKNRWFWGQTGCGNGQYAYCPACKEKVSVQMVENEACNLVSICKHCKSIVEWRDRE